MVPCWRLWPCCYFYPRSPRGERPYAREPLDKKGMDISIHAPREGSDEVNEAITEYLNEFLSTLPARGATSSSSGLPTTPTISIHAPREESDCYCRAFHAPLRDFYPRSPRGERLDAGNHSAAGRLISIHAPREGSDKGVPGMFWFLVPFLSTLPARGATQAQRGQPGRKKISIHAPREGSDLRHFRQRRQHRISIHAPREGSDSPPRTRTVPGGHFYPRSPRGERLLPYWQGSILARFLSTLPARGATKLLLDFDRQDFISIHAPREGSDGQTKRR